MYLNLNTIYNVAKLLALLGSMIRENPKVVGGARKTGKIHVI